jgi:hypothetical protein
MDGGLFPRGKLPVFARIFIVGEAPSSPPHALRCSDGEVLMPLTLSSPLTHLPNREVHQLPLEHAPGVCSQPFAPSPLVEYAGRSPRHGGASRGDG